MNLRPEVTGARRIVVKVGSSSLTTSRIRAASTPHGSGSSSTSSRRSGREVPRSSWCPPARSPPGLAPLGLKKRPRALAAQQAAASVGQGLLVHRYTEELARHDIVTGQVLLTVDDVVRRAHYRNAYQTFAKLLELGVLPIVNENDTVATSEIRFGDNDRLAALVAHLVHADLLLLLSDVDGLYDGHPRHDGTSLLTDVRGEADLARVRTGAAGAAGVGTGGMATKVDAARIATGAGIPVVLTAAEQASSALAGDPVGTLFHATGRRRPTRLLWLAHATEPKGQLVLDAGAVRAIVERRASLLAAGVTGVRGTFVAGDPIDLLDPAGTPVARGTGQLRRRRGPRPAGPVVPRAQGGARGGLRA